MNDPLTPASSLAEPSDGPRAGSLTLRPSLLEFIGEEILEAQDVGLIRSKALDYLESYLSADGLLVLLFKNRGLSVVGGVGTLSHSLIGRVFEEKNLLEQFTGGDRSIYIPDLATSPRVAESAILAGLQAEGTASVLLSRAGQSGLLAAVDHRPDAFRAFDEANMNSVAFQLGYLIDAGGGNRRLAGFIEEFDRLLSSPGADRNSDSLSGVLQSLLETAVELSGADTGSFLAFDGRDKKLVLKASVGLDQAPDPVHVNLGEGLSGWAAGRRRPILISNLNGEIGDGQTVEGKTAQAMIIPVALGDRLIGVVNLGAGRPGKSLAAGGLKHVLRLFGQIGLAAAASEAVKEWRGLYIDTLKVLVRVIESRDPFSRGHAARVAEYAVALAGKCGLAEETVEAMEIAALLHDIGLADLPSAVFKSGGPLNDVEAQLIRSHPGAAARVLSEVELLREVANIILHHHEHFDGSGYVDGLRGDEIPLGSRILAVAEAYTAITAERAHRAARSPAEAVAELRGHAGTQFDPSLVTAFCEWLAPGSGPENNQPRKAKKAVSIKTAKAGAAKVKTRKRRER